MIKDCTKLLEILRSVSYLLFHDIAFFPFLQWWYQDEAFSNDFVQPLEQYYRSRRSLDFSLDKTIADFCSDSTFNVRNSSHSGHTGNPGYLLALWLFWKMKYTKTKFVYSFYFGFFCAGNRIDTAFGGLKGRSHSTSNLDLRIMVVYAVVQFYPCFKFYFPLFLVMVMYDNEFQTNGNLI